MPRRTLILAAATLVLVLLVAAQAFGRPGSKAQTCSTNPDSSLHWEAVFGHATSLWQATLIQRSIQLRGFKGTQFEKDSCDDVEVSVPGLDIPPVRNQFAREASQAGIDVSFEPPDILKRPNADVV